MGFSPRVGMLAAALSASAAIVSAKPLELTAWVIHWDGGASVQDFVDHASMVTRVAPGWYRCNAEGLPEALGPEQVDPAEKKKLLAAAKANGVKVMALTSNFDSQSGDFESGRISKFLNDPHLMQRHVEGLLRLAQEDGADGIDLDYESMKATDRDAFSVFVEALAKALHAQGLQLAIAVQPKTSEPGNWEGVQAQDWKRIGAAVDDFRLMAYDYHWSTSGPGPIAPEAWVKEVLTLALSLVPKEKIELGVPAYGYDWLQKTSVSFGWSGFQDLIKAKGAKVERDPDSQELHMDYEGHEVWFADSQAMLSKFGLAKQAGIRGLALWRVGSEDPGFWKELKSNR